MEKIMNVENEWDQMVADMVEGVTDEVMEATNKVKLGKAAGPSEVNMDMIIVSGKFGVGVIKKLCQRVLDGKGKPEVWKTSVVVSIFKGKGDMMDRGAYRGVKLLEHAMKIVLENRIRGLVTIETGNLALCLGKARLMHCLFLGECMRSFEKESKRCRPYMRFVGLKKAFDRVPKKAMEWALRKKGLAEVLEQAVKSLYDLRLRYIDFFFWHCFVLT